MRRSWQVWPGTGFPCSRTSEALLVARLSDLAAGRRRPPDRDALTVLMSLLRSGADLTSSVELAPGVSRMVPSLLGTYEALSSARSEAESAWAAFLTASSAAGMLAAAPAFAPLLPVPADAVLSASVRTVALLRPELVRRVEHVAAMASVLERRLESSVSPVEVRLLAPGLFGVGEPGIYQDPFYLADRVASCSPDTVSRLLPGLM